MKRAIPFRAFSLVELIIVVVIIGVIAAIAAPRISRGAKGSGDSALRASLTSLREAIDRYAAEHMVFPGSTVDPLTGSRVAGTQAQLVNQLTTKTDVHGNVGTTPGVHIYGPYLPEGLPPLPVGANIGSTKVLIVAGAPAVDESGGQGWVYSWDTGHIIANTNATNGHGKAWSSY